MGINYGTDTHCLTAATWLFDIMILKPNGETTYFKASDDKLLTPQEYTIKVVINYAEREKIVTDKFAISDKPSWHIVKENPRQ